MKDKIPHNEKPFCALIGEDGNAFAIIGRVKKALIKAGHKDLAKQFQTEAMSGDYDNLFMTALLYVRDESETEDEDEDEEGNY